MMSKKNSLSVIGALLVLLVLALVASSARSEELTPLQRAIDGTRNMLVDQRGYVGPWSASCKVIAEDALVCLPTAHPLMPLSTCDDCVKAGEIVCGQGKVDPAKTKKTSAAGSSGGSCDGMCMDGTMWHVECTTPILKPLTIVDEPDPAGIKPQPVPMGERK